MCIGAAISPDISDDSTVRLGRGASGTVIEIRGLTKAYAPGCLTLKPTSLCIREGEFIAIVGPSGAGKSTFVRCFNRLVEPTAGSVRFYGVDTKAISKTTLRRRIAMIFQSFNLVPRLSVLTNVLIGRLGYRKGWRSLVPGFGGADKQIALDALARVQLLHKAWVHCEDLSGGQQQRVAIARAIAQGAEILIADEPVASLDPVNARAVLDLLKGINREDRITVIVNLHQLDLARAYADRIIALKAGTVVFDGSPSALDQGNYERIYN